jgi:hypothetical protein
MGDIVMDNAVVDAYVKGKLAGSKYFRESQQNPKATAPANPNSGASYLASVEWDRGFTDGFAQGGVVAVSRSSPARGVDGKRRSA